DSPEFSGEVMAAGEKWVRELGIGLRATGLQAVMNLNNSIPPSWARNLATGPLFSESTAFHESAGVPSDRLLDQILAEKSSLTWIHWHLGERDFRPKNGEQIHNLTRLILEALPLTIAFDRSSQTVSLAEGLNRQHSALLMAVGLHLPRLADQPGV